MPLYRGNNISWTWTNGSTTIQSDAYVKYVQMLTGQTPTTRGPDVPADETAPYPMPEGLTFVKRGGGYTTYRDASGNMVYLQHKTRKPLKRLEDMDRVALYQSWYEASRFHSWPSWRENLKDEVTKPGDCKYIEQCSFCSYPHVVKTKDYAQVGKAGRINVEARRRKTGTCCTACATTWNLRECIECHSIGSRYSSMYTVEDSAGTLCYLCAQSQRRYLYCDSCSVYFPRERARHHSHNPRTCTCESPQRDFKVRNGGRRVKNDSSFTVSIPAGEISDEGFGQMASYLRTWAAREFRISRVVYYHSEYTPAELKKIASNNDWNAMSYRLSELGDKWQTKRGNFTKRLSQFAHKEYKIKVPPEVLSQIGTIGREHSQGTDYRVQVTRNLNLPREEFAHSGSCWWSEYAQSRCAFKSSGGFGLRSFGEASGRRKRRVEGRAWVMPLKRSGNGNGLVPTFTTDTPDAFVVFNGYGNLDGYTGARLVSQMYGMTYRKISFECSPMYVNSCAGYLVAPEELASHYTDGRLYLEVQQHSDLFNQEQAANERELANA